MRYFFPLFILVAVLAGATSSCKNPAETKPNDTTKVDTSHIDTTHHDTTHVDTTHHTTPNDTTSHNFTWTEYTIPGENDMTGCWVFGPNDMWVMNGNLYHYDGAGFKQISVKRDNDNQVLDWALSGFHIFAFNHEDAWFTYAGVVEHWNGETVHEKKFSEAEVAFLHASWGTSSKDMFFVGDKGTILHFDGENWLKYPQVTTKDLRSVWGTSSKNVWATGYNGSTAESVVLHFDGTVWKEVSLSTDGTAYQWGLGSVWCTDSAHHPVTVLAGSTVFRSTDNKSWRCDTAKVGNRLPDGTYVGIAVQGNNANDLFAAGGWGFLSHWNGNSWHPYSEFYAYGAQQYGAGGMSVHGNTVCIAGVKGGNSWVLIGQR